MRERYSRIYKENIGNGIKKEIRDSDPVLQRCRFVSFVSRSAGRRRKRKDREINLLLVDNKYAFQVIRGEIKPRKRNNFVEPDVLALEILSDLPYEERSVEILIQRVMKGI